MDKNARKGKILDIILRTHIDKAEPVGSKYVSDIMGLSSATVRNLMAELENEGYVCQPHTSAGRIPTERAYKSYVNTLIHPRDNTLSELRSIDNELFSKYSKYSDIMEKTSYAVSKLTRYTAFVIYPRDHIYMDGAFHMLEQPEFFALPEIKKILRMFDEKKKLLEVMNIYISTGALKIHIGRENTLEGLNRCGIITASYRVRNKVVGGLGIIGPIRMKYRRVVPIVKYLADTVSRMLDGL